MEVHFVFDVDHYFSNKQNSIRKDERLDAPDLGLQQSHLLAHVAVALSDGSQHWDQIIEGRVVRIVEPSTDLDAVGLLQTEVGGSVIDDDGLVKGASQLLQVFQVGILQLLKLRVLSVQSVSHEPRRVDLVENPTSIRQRYQFA